MTTPTRHRSRPERFRSPSRHHRRTRGRSRDARCPSIVGRLVLAAAIVASIPPPLRAQVGDRPPPPPDTTPPGTTHIAVAEALAGLDDFITTAMARWRVPGLAVGVGQL